MSRTKEQIEEEMIMVSDELIMPFAYADDSVLLDGNFSLNELVKLGKLAEEYINLEK